MRVEMWSDVVCPWCYLGKRRLELALAQVPFGSEVEVVTRSFQLDPSAPKDTTAETATVLAQRYGLSAERVQSMQQEMEERAALDGLEYHLAGQRSGSTFDAHRVIHLAREQGLESAMVERLFRAYFTEGRSVFDPESLQELASEAGLDGDAVAEVLAGDRYSDAVAADLAQARAYGISGVPFYVIDGRLGVSGAQSVDVLRRALEEAAVNA